MRNKDFFEIQDIVVQAYFIFTKNQFQLPVPRIECNDKRFLDLRQRIFKYSIKHKNENHQSISAGFRINKDNKLQVGLFLRYKVGPYKVKWFNITKIQMDFLKVALLC